MGEHRFSYEWRLSDGYPAKGIESHGSTVFDTFVCGGGSSMGLKLAGYHHLGGVELDEKVAAVYKANHSPEHFYTMDVRDFNKLTDLPEELYSLDLFSTSPPCSTFSRAGDLEKAYGKRKRFAEGQKLQTLDDLVFVACDTIAILQPKTFIMENSGDIIKSNGASYAKRIVDKLMRTGYVVQVFSLNAANMGVPQARERVFFIGHKAEYKLPRLTLDFHEPYIYFGEFMEHDAVTPRLSAFQQGLWERRIPSDMSFGDIIMRLQGRYSMCNSKIYHSDRVVGTLAAGTSYAVYDYPRQMTEREIMLAGTFPLDYKYKTLSDLRFLVGMAVPPVMMAQISYEVWRQWISKIRNS